MKYFQKAMLGVAALAFTGSGSAAVADSRSDVMVMAWNVDAIASFDPAQAADTVTVELLQNLCDRLVDIDPNDETKVVPGLAESWEVSDDGLTITFRLRDDLKFPNGKAATAGDMAWSLQRVVQIGLGAATAITEYGFNKGNVETSITAPDDRTLVLKLDKPYPSSLVLQGLGAYYVAALVDRETVLANAVEGDLGNKYLSTRTECVGPYKLARWNPGEVVVYERNDVYHGQKPAMRQIIIRHVAETGTQRLMLEKGDVDVARDLMPEDISNLAKQPDVRIETTYRPTITHLTLNNAHEALAKEEVRMALRYLLDYDAMQDSFLKNIGVMRGAPVQLGAFGALDEKEGQPFHLDIDKARELLAKAGYADGFEIKMVIGTHSYAMPIAQHFQQNAAKVGIKVSIERMANAQLFAKVRGREFELAIMSWTTSVGDAHGMLSRQVYNPDNSAEAKYTQYPSWRSSYYSQQYNTQVMDALMERDPSKREEMYKQIQRDMMEIGPQVYIFQTTQAVAVRNTLKNWRFNSYRAYYNLASK
ncbi:ABC transporter substrate-binding protein [Arvimicrobium flavum]|uniref:ABC transporter substrate-binding protein n=1 Tax=Arvimicrobium flavum TaxID=3393320 RepID=UPI00237AEE29|nr:ABC transporter substrate-binding protein [Mesorhizobium shangrilense]